jgi:hypothetical protein
MPPASTPLGTGQGRHARPSFPTYVLGLADGFRGAELLAQLAACGISAEHVPAVDAAALDPAQLAAIYDSDAARWIERELVPAEAACALGHLMMLRRFLLTGSEWALFLEDDATILRDPTPLRAILDGASAAPTVVHLTSTVPVPAGARRVAGGGGCWIWEVGAPPDGTVGYAANRALARLAVDAYRDQRVDSTADWPIRWRYDARFAVCVPPLVAHVGSDSSIEIGRVLAQASGIRDRRTRLRRLVATLCGPRLVAAGRHDYPVALAFRHNVIAPVARAARRRERGT